MQDVVVSIMKAAGGGWLTAESHCNIEFLACKILPAIEDAGMDLQIFGSAAKH